MARLGVSPVFKAYDSDGSVLASGTVETYITGTSTPKNTWSNQAESSGAATSFTLDTNGESVRYFDTDAAYKLIIKDSSGTTVRTIDPYVPVPIATQLDEDLDVNGYAIVSSANGDISITPNGTGDIILDGIKWPQADGTSGQVLKTDGAGQGSWVTVNTDLAADASPQLGADLDGNSYDIQFDDATGIRDDADNEQLIFQKTASAVNYIEITNAATGNSPSISAAGSDTNPGLILAGQGSGAVRISGLDYPTSDGSANQFVVTDGAGTLSFSYAGASQAQMETGTATTVYVTPAVAQYHASAAKGWVSLDTAASDLASYNVSSMVDNGTGDYTINWDTDFSSSNYVVLGSYNGSNDSFVSFDTPAAGSINVNVIDSSAGTASETGMTSVFVVALGDQ